MPISQERLHQLLLAGERYKAHFDNLVQSISYESRQCRFGQQTWEDAWRNLGDISRETQPGLETTVLAVERTKYDLTQNKNRHDREKQEQARRDQGKPRVINQEQIIRLNGEGGNASRFVGGAGPARPARTDGVAAPPGPQGNDRKPMSREPVPKVKFTGIPATEEARLLRLAAAETERDELIAIHGPGFAALAAEGEAETARGGGKAPEEVAREGDTYDPGPEEELDLG